ncbi:MAG: glutathione S-transferase family protein [Rhodocyclaceae bacterium]|nr:glutathione S-transferase family protein [Rhodocyclaceae bacterium]
MPRPYLFYGIPTSMFSASTRAYLRFKNIPYVEKPPSMYTYMVTIKKRCGSPQSPVIVDPDGRWIADSSDIIDTLEKRFPHMPVVPETPKQKFAAYLFELWGKEFWYTTALHTRWSHPENYAIWEADMCRMLPGLPQWLRGLILRKSAQPMLNAHHKPMGLKPENFEIIDRWTDAQLDLLEAHFAQYLYLFGSRPSLGDMGIIITPFGHMYLDPWSRQNLIDPRPNLKAWIERVQEPKPLQGDFLPGDEIPPTLLPLLQGMCHDMVPHLHGTLKELLAILPQTDGSDRLPRTLGMIEQAMGERSIQRVCLPYTLWQTQRMLDVYRGMSAADADTVRDWLASIDGEGFLSLDIPRLRRVGLHAAIDNTATK